MRRALAIALLCAGCGEDAASFATVELGLSEVPPSVTSLTVVVRRGDDVVTSATVPPDLGSIALGVPAEIPLEFTVLARTNRPGPPGIDRMPAYVGRVVRSIPLAAEATRVALTLRPAGVLTVIAPAGGNGDGVRVRFEGDEDAVSLRVREEGFVQSYVVRAGVLRATTPSEGHRLDAPGRIFVAREAESVYVLTLSPVVDPEDGISLDLRIPERLPVPAETSLVITASTASGDGVEDEAALVSWRIDSAPAPGALATPDGDAAGTAVGLPAAPIPLVARGPARAWVHAEARLASGVDAEASKVVEVGSSTAGPPFAVVARLADVDERRTGTALLIEVIDARGGYAIGATVAVDLSASDPWIDLGGAPRATIDARDRGRTLREIAAPSGPRERPLLLVVTATATGFSSTATVVLPPLDTLGQ